MNKLFYGAGEFRKIFVILFFSLFSFQAFAQNLEILNLQSLEKKVFLENLEKSQKVVEENIQTLSAIQANIGAKLEERNQILNEIEQEIPQINFIFSSKESPSQEILLKDVYKKTNYYWRILVDNSLEFFSKKDKFNLDYPAGLAEKIIIPAEFQEEPLAQEYQASLQTLATEYQKFLDSKKQFIAMVRDRQFGLMLHVGKKRADLFNKISKSDPDFIKSDQFYFDDFTRELKLIPYRPLMFFYSKILSYKELANGGFGGIVAISRQILFLIFSLVAIIWGVTFFKKTNSFLEKLRENFLRSSFQNQGRQHLAISAAKLIPYFPWIFLIIVFESAYFFIELTAASEISQILPYFIYYFLYRIFKIAFSSILQKAVSLDFYDINLNKKIADTTQLLGLYLLISACFLHLSAMIVRRAIVYSWVLGIFEFGLIAMVIYLANKWRAEISAKFSAQIYRKKLNASDAKKKIPDAYVKNFSDVENDFMQIASSHYQQVKNVLALWLEGKSKENSMVIYGADGMGKTSLLNHSEKELRDAAPQLKIVRINFHKKITGKKEFAEFVIKALAIEGSAASLEKVIANYPEKILIILDGCENLFLSKKDGFAAFKFFADLVNISSSNIFWMTSFNSYSWHYLSNAIDHSNYFRYQFKLPCWSDEEIKNLIIKRHEKSRLKLVYDALIFEMHFENSAKESNNIQKKFFQMLWEQSGGNPTTAIDLWLSALRVVDKSTLKITLPKTVRFSHLVELSDQQLFAYAAILKHRKLSLEELIDVTSFSKGIALNAIRAGMELGYLHRLEDDSYSISDLWKILIPSLLTRKNFIYE